ncbi:hypothetical protein DFH08DRAFT_840570 [Mycena albidolilacea]|uniref:DUF6533 domain-containing protein n=1 Tax=Mycena albidolilacea TaxID=1033008 RepID=A0AAD7ALC6_9AGAR|nr:hypothetical protein DFH08DRAFT_840570 [Mycena albidolilacea]
MTAHEVHVWQVAVQGHHNRASALTLMVWDYLITFEDERELFWKRRPWTFATFLFLWVRYGGILLISCYSWFRLEGGIGMSISWAIQIILQLRIYALYDASPRIGALIVSAFSLEVLAVVGMFGFGSADATVVAEAVGVMVRCNVTAVPAWLWVLWVPVTSFELLLCVLALYKGYQRVESTGHKALQDILVRDSVLYYLAIQCVYIFNLFCWVKDVEASLEALTALAVALPSIMSGRMMINLRYALVPPNTMASPSEISLEEITLPGP